MRTICMYLAPLDIELLRAKLCADQDIKFIAPLSGEGFEAVDEIVALTPGTQFLWFAQDPLVFVNRPIELSRWKRILARNVAGVAPQVIPSEMGSGAVMKLILFPPNHSRFHEVVNGASEPARLVWQYPAEGSQAHQRWWSAFGRWVRKQGRSVQLASGGSATVFPGVPADTRLLDTDP